MPEEPQLNGRIASIINKLTGSARWNAREELRGALRGPKTKPDILITRLDGPPVVVETEYPPNNTLEGDCLKSIGRDLDPERAGAAGRVSSVIAIRATEQLKNAATGDDAQQMLEAGHEIEFAVYQGNAEEHSRFPDSGYIKGNMHDLVDFVRPASEPKEAIEQATKAFREGVQDAATWILDAAKGSKMGELIAERLRQPWPAYPANPPQTAEEIRQENADQSVRAQTARMTAAILINALAYQQNLAGYSAEVEIEGKKETRTIKSLAQIRQPTGLHQDNVIAEWDNILAINYWPIFHIAKQLLSIIPPTTATKVLEEAAGTANAIQETVRQNDVAGSVFQRLISDRQTLATYYTRPESAALAARLAVPDNLDWANPETLKEYRVADYACGTGGLVLAAYQRARDLHRNNGGDPDSLHGYMMENSLTACDIMPAAVHLTSSILSAVSPRERYTGTRNVLYPFGGTGAKDGKGKPIVEVGSLALLDLSTTRSQAVLPLNEQMALGATKERRPIEVDMTPLNQSLVIMNPPFTTPTNHAADHAKPGNPAFAAFNTTEEEQKAMAEKVKRLSKGTISDGNAGLGTQFTAIAHNMVKPNGHIALILPLSAMLGGSDNPSARSWLKLRGLLSEGYNDITIVTIAGKKDIDCSFSSDTAMAEAMIIARRLGWGERPGHLAHFVNLGQRPSSKLSAQQTAKAIKETISGLTQVGAHSTIKMGEDDIGTASLERISPTEKWTNVRVANPNLVRTSDALHQGKLLLPRRAAPIDVPITRMGKIGRVGPVDRDIAGGSRELSRGPFTRDSGANSGTEWPLLWNRNSTTQQSMKVSPDSHGIVKPGKQRAAEEIWQRASHLHISKELRFNSSATCAAFTDRASLGGRSWPSFVMESPDMEKTSCVWLNGTLGLISFWINSNRSQSGRGGTSVRAIPDIPVLDFSKLSEEQIQAAVQIYDDLSEETMLPANEAHRDEVRQELDRRIITEVLRLDKEAVEQLAILRNQWCMEPTVTGTKGTGPKN